MSIEAKYTISPWQVQNGTYRGFDQRDVATVYCVDTVPTEDGLGANHVTIIGTPRAENFQQEQTANACLIAAAPELLEALEELLIVWRNEGKRPGWVKRFSEAQAKAAAAIAKATGKELAA